MFLITSPMFPVQPSVFVRACSLLNVKNLTIYNKKEEVCRLKGDYKIKLPYCAKRLCFFQQLHLISSADGATSPLCLSSGPFGLRSSVWPRPFWRPCCIGGSRRGRLLAQSLCPFCRGDQPSSMSFLVWKLLFHSLDILPFIFPPLWLFIIVWYWI